MWGISAPLRLAARLGLIPIKCCSSPGLSTLQQSVEPGTAGARLTPTSNSPSQTPPHTTSIHLSLLSCTLLPGAAKTQPLPLCWSCHRSTGTAAPQPPQCQSQGHPQAHGSGDAAALGSAPHSAGRHRWSELLPAQALSSSWGPGSAPSWSEHRPLATPRPPSLLHLSSRHWCSCHPLVLAAVRNTAPAAPDHTSQQPFDPSRPQARRQLRVLPLFLSRGCNAAPAWHHPCNSQSPWPRKDEGRARPQVQHGSSWCFITTSHCLIRLMSKSWLLSPQWMMHRDTSSPAERRIQTCRELLRAETQLGTARAHSHELQREEPPSHFLPAPTVTARLLH